MMLDLPILAAGENWVLIGLASILVLGVLAQWAAWRLKVPAILLLLGVGLIVGPGMEVLTAASWWPWEARRLLDPELLLGHLLMPLVSLSVAIILFEGGLTLDVRELYKGAAWRTILQLVSAGALVTLVLTALAARWVVGLSWPVAILLGAILVVTGPTVIGPLLRHVRPKGAVGPILKWEGIVIDPIGATAAVLVFEAIAAPSGGRAVVVMQGVLNTVLVGLVVGGLASLFLVLVMRRVYAPDLLHTPMTLMVVVAAFAGSNAMQSESGLVTVTVMGIILANQRTVGIVSIAEFKEVLTNLLICILFVVLAARVRPEQLADLGWRSVVFIALLIGVVRPASVAISTLGSALTLRERAFLAWMAPRGIVAAAVSSVFALRMEERGFAEAEALATLTLAVIIGSVLVYGLTGRPMAKLLGLARPGAHGFLIAGANSLAREIATALQKQGVEVLLVDLNHANISAARLAGLPVMRGSIFSSKVNERIDLSGIGRLLALTPNDEVNTLAAVHFARWFGRSNVYQLAPGRRDHQDKRKATEEIRGLTLFGPGRTFSELSGKLAAGATVRVTPLSKEFTMDRLRQQTGGELIPMFVRNDSSGLGVFTQTHRPNARPGDTIISLAGGIAGTVESAPAAPRAG